MNLDESSQDAILFPSYVGRGVDMRAPYLGSPIAHPDRKFVKRYTGRVQDQTRDVAQMMSMIRLGWSTERAPRPIGEILLTLEKKETIFGSILIESMSSVRNGIAQFILSRWDEQIFRWYLVQITTEDNLVIEEWENPPDLYHVSSPRILA